MTYYYDVIEKKRIIDQGIYEIKIANFSIHPKPGQFVSLVLPSESEIPLGIGDYDEFSKTLKLYIESEKLASRIGKRVILKGPMGKPLDFSGLRTIIGVAYGNLYHDLLYPLRFASKIGIRVLAKCVDCHIGYEEPKSLEEGDLIIVSMPLHLLHELNLPARKTLVYNRWVKMNCSLGVCGICEVKGKLVCVEGPFMRLEEVVD
ncbi:2-polyprenylphenol hydroxylase [Sulfolobus tengchongensis]|uniref:2-polyprenylphenol hydroxylase n=1 Tax=Sulfolobus tengchongensis TaxID=207809 RepID=A0AAX4KZ53_9CREN